jgi:hypothetical protein
MPLGEASSTCLGYRNASSQPGALASPCKSAKGDNVVAITHGTQHSVPGAESTRTSWCGLHRSIELLKKLCACRQRCNR